MVSAIKYYAPIDMTLDNKIVNLDDPVNLQDAVTKSYSDLGDLQTRNLVPLTNPGDLLYLSSLGNIVVSSQPTELGTIAGGNQPRGSRVTNLVTGHVIRCQWEARHYYDNPKTQFLYGYATNGSAVVCQVQGTSTNVPTQTDTWKSYSVDLVLTNGATEVQLIGADGDRSWYKNLLFTDLTGSSPDRLPIGDTGEVLRVAAGVPAWEALTGKIEFGFGGSSAPSLGIRTDFEVPYGLTITGWTVIADEVGDLQVDLWKDTYANFPPTVADTVTGSDKPRLSGEQKATSSALTGWTTSWAAGDIIRVNLDSLTTIKRATVILNFTRVT